MWLHNAIVRSSPVGCSCASQSGGKESVGGGSSSHLHTQLQCNSHVIFIYGDLREIRELKHIIIDGNLKNKTKQVSSACFLWQMVCCYFCSSNQNNVMAWRAKYASSAHWISVCLLSFSLLFEFTRSTVYKEWIMHIYWNSSLLPKAGHSRMSIIVLIKLFLHSCRTCKSKS